jgi:hypothetical protein
MVGIFCHHLCGIVDGLFTRKADKSQKIFSLFYCFYNDSYSVKLSKDVKINYTIKLGSS